MQLYYFTPRSCKLLPLLVRDNSLDGDIEVGHGTGVVTQPDPVRGVREAGEIYGMSEIRPGHLRNIKY